MVPMKPTVLSLAVALSVSGVLPAAAALVPHRAIYDIALESATDRSGVTGIDGRMVYEFNGSQCEGYTMNFRFVTEVRSDDLIRLSDQRATTWEDGAGTTFTFASRSYVDSRLDREVRGTATAKDGRTIVELVKPEKVRHELAATLFPTRHMLDLLQRIRDGETFYETSIFDGSDNADQVLTTTVVVGRRATTAEGDPEAPAVKALPDQAYWPVSIAYFEEPEERGEELPIYRLAFKLHENGVTRSIVMDYGDFAMRGKLVGLDLYEPASDCAQ
jgi:hypothetical protein